MKVPATIIWQDQCLKLLDQRVLPREVRYLTIETLDQAVEAIRTLAVRGAPAIGVAAGAVAHQVHAVGIDVLEDDHVLDQPVVEVVDVPVFNIGPAPVGQAQIHHP